jgi:phosphatidylserine decarboxylase
MALAAVVAIGTVAVAVGRRSFALWLVAFVLTLVALWVAYFFRDPERAGPRGEGLVIAPADGRVLPVVEVDEPTFLHGRALRVSIFMNIFNVHVNRYPVNGRVTHLHYNPGRFLNAASDKASLDNEQMSVGIETVSSRVLMRQIAGLVARRIVTYTRQGDTAVQGERFGLIRFGSRVDVFVPVGSRSNVREGEIVQAGATVLAELER